MQLQCSVVLVLLPRPSPTVIWVSNQKTIGEGSRQRDYSVVMLLEVQYCQTIDSVSMDSAPRNRTDALGGLQCPASVYTTHRNSASSL